MNISELLSDLHKLQEYLINHELELAEDLLSTIIEEVEIFDEDNHKDEEDIEYND